MQPASQKNRPISFLLFDHAERTPLVAYQDLIIRPEELTRSEPNRANITQTLGGAWLDDFGAGISTINIAGHTGWRGSINWDGAEIFQMLRDTVFTEWNKRRSNRPSQSSPPDDVELIFADQLNQQAMVVAVTNFQLRRHRSRPLLSQYSIQMAVLSELHASDYAQEQDSLVDAITAPNRAELAKNNLDAVIARQQGIMDKLGAVGMARELESATGDFLSKTNDMLASVRNYASDFKSGFDSVAGPLVATSVQVLEAGKNIYQMLAMPSNVAAYVKATFQQIAGNLDDALCTIKNGFRRLLDLPDFSDLYGASTCSSTGGGRPTSPWAQLNPFEELYPTVVTPASTISAPCANAIAASMGDGLLSTATTATLTSNLRLITGGFTFPAVPA